MKKASIITLQYVNNFGSLLQTYATQEIVKKYGYNGEIVNYTRENCRYDYQKKEAFARYRNRHDVFSFYPIARLLQLRWEIIYQKRQKLFDQFRNDYLNLSREYHSYEDLKENPPEADVYITGSDQVWNFQYNGGLLKEYYLDFAPENKPRIALSASIGQESISDEEAKQISPYLKKYRGISVREKSALKLLEKAGYFEGIQVVDPTLMLSKDKWSRNFNLRKTDDRYVLLYQLNPNPKMIRFVEKLVEDNNMTLVILNGGSKDISCPHKYIHNARVEDFLSSFYNASYVVTDSFHGTAFSFNFNKNVFVFDPPKFSTRLHSVLSLVHCENRNVKENLNWKSYEEIDFEMVNKILDNERNRVDLFLRNML